MIGVFSGTSDGRKITEKLLEEGYSVVSFNATTAGGEHYNSHPNLVILTEMLDKKEILVRLEKYKIKAIVDATHPYAQVITEHLKSVCQQVALPYFRYSRETYTVDGYKTYKEIADALESTEGNILITSGSKNLKELMAIDHKRLFIRMLPVPSMLQAVLDLGIKSYQIIGMQGPFSYEMNKATINMYQIKHLVTKESGKSGGFIEKINAAKECKVATYILNRPNKEDGSMTYDEIIEKVRKL